MRWLAGVVGIGGMLLLQPAMASSPSLSDQILACASRPQAERLACYERTRERLLASTSPTATPPAAPRPPASAPAATPPIAPAAREASGWSLRTEGNRVTLSSETSGRSAGGAPVILVACVGNERLEVTLRLNAPLGASQPLDGRLLIAQQAAVATPWTSLADGRGAVSRAPRDLVQRARSADSMTIEIADPRNVRHRAQFSMTGFRELLPELGCARALNTPTS